MKTRSLHKILTALLAATPGCSGTISATGDAAADASLTDLPALDMATTDEVARDAPDAVVADVPVDVQPDRYCGMCGCEFTGRLEGSTAMRTEYCADYVPDAGATDDAATGDAATDASLPDPAMCQIDCNRACGGVMVSGMGLFRPWGGFGGIGGAGPGTCERADGGTVRCIAYVPCGRRTDGQRDLDAEGGISGYLRRAAYLESQAVGAFTRMSDELAAHGAPASLVRAARRSAREEARHASLMRDVCEERGVGDVPAADAPTGVRSLAEVARENAVEGCAGETWGALMAMHQAARAEDPALRTAMEAIARDEVRHAALAWAVHRWAMDALDADARAEAERAREDAWDALERAVARDPEIGMARALGLPDGVTGARLARGLRTALARV